MAVYSALCTDGLGGVLYHRNPILFGTVEQRFHLCRLSVKMDHDDGFHPLAIIRRHGFKFLFQLNRVKVPIFRIDIQKNRSRIQTRDHPCGCKEGKIGG